LQEVENYPIFVLEGGLFHNTEPINLPTMFSAKSILVFFSGMIFLSVTSANAQVIDKVKESTMEKVEEKAVEKSEELSDAIFEKIEGLFKKKKKEEAPEETEPAKKEETVEPKTVKKGRPVRSS